MYNVLGLFARSKEVLFTLFYAGDLILRRDWGNCGDRRGGRHAVGFKHRRLQGSENTSECALHDASSYCILQLPPAASTTSKTKTHRDLAAGSEILGWFPAARLQVWRERLDRYV